jgi:hypothetical protein
MDEITPRRPRRGLDLTQSVIMQVRTQKAIMIPTLRVKKGWCGSARILYFFVTVSPAK